MLTLTNGLNVSLISLYVRPRTNISTNIWTQFFSNIQKPFLVGGDFNAHHVAWGCQNSDIYGKNIIDSLEQHNIMYLNNGAPTYIGNYENQNSAIDLSLTSSCFHHLLDWFTLEDTYGSDHIPIIINCQIKSLTLEYKNSKLWNTKRANWNAYHIECLNNVDDFNTNNYNEFILALNKSASDSIPKYVENRAKNNRGKSWWNESCTNAVNTRKDKFSTYKRNPNLDNLLSYKKADAQAKKLLKQTKRDSWRNFCSSLSKNVPITKVWQKLNSFKNRKQQNKQVTDLNSEWVTNFHIKLTQPYVSNNYVSTGQINLDNQNRFLVRPFGLGELERALKQTNSSAPGIDQVQYSMLFYLPQRIKSILLEIYNSIYSNLHPIPVDWTKYLIVPIIKPGKQPNLESSYRPISLASCILKTYERIIKNRLEFWLEKSKKIPKTQYGFRRKCSTQEVLAHLLTDIQLGFSSNKSTSALFLDIQGAYDNVDLQILWSKLDKLGIPTQIINNLYAIYNCRHLYIKAHNGITMPRQASLGLAQGSILSPLLYTIYTYDLELLFNDNIKILQFADDVCIYTTGTSIEVCNNKIDTKFQETLKWFDNNGLTISQEKSVMCTFTRSRFSPQNTIRLADMNIPYKTSIKYLGMHIDKKLLWKEHINHIIKRTENGLNVLRAFCSHKWGADPNICLLFYRSLIKSIMDYGSTFYGSAATTHLKKIDSIKNKCLRMSVGYLKSTPTNVVEMETSEPPLNLRRRLLSDKFLLKQIAKDSTLINKVNDLTILVYTNRYWNKKKSPLLVESYSWITQMKDNVHQTDIIPYFIPEYEAYNGPPRIDFTLENSLDLSSAYRKNFNQQLSTKWIGFEHIFTDGYSPKIFLKLKYHIGCPF